MADAGDAEGTDTRETPAARMEFVDALPGGRTVLPVETDGEIVWLVLRGEMTDRLIGELNEYFALITRANMWTQNWGGPTGKPPQYRQAS